jgi:hypothetical protein
MDQEEDDGPRRSFFVLQPPAALRGMACELAWHAGDASFDVKANRKGHGETLENAEKTSRGKNAVMPAEHARRQWSVEE